MADENSPFLPACVRLAGEYNHRVNMNFLRRLLPLMAACLMTQGAAGAEAERGFDLKLVADGFVTPTALAAVPGQFLALVFSDVLHHDWSVHWVVPLPWPYATVQSSDRNTANWPTPLSTLRRLLQDSWQQLLAPQADDGFLACPKGQARLRHSPYAHDGVRLAWFEWTGEGTGDDHDVRPNGDAMARPDTALPAL